MNILVTGANGFIGGALVRVASQYSEWQVIAGVRKACIDFPQNIQPIKMGDLLLDTDYSEALKGVDVVVHVAARAHIMDDVSADPLAEFRKVNVDGTLNLARQSVQAGVKRFVFMSSIGVNGNNTSKPFTEMDSPHPHNAYAIAKYEAESALLKLSAETGLEVVMIRPPLVYARHAPGNFKSLIKWVNKGIPFPFGAVHNKRSLVALDNLVDFIITCIEHPKAANETFLISDGEDVSTTELLQKVAKALDKPAHLIPVPVGLMQFAAKLMGKADVAERLFASLQVDSRKARELLGWKPVITMDEQLKKTVEAYKHETTI